jgi:hypothetical protein
MEQFIDGHCFIADYPKDSQTPKFRCIVRLDEPVGWSAGVVDRRPANGSNSIMFPAEYVVTPEAGRARAEEDLFRALDGAGLPREPLAWRELIPQRR